MANATKEVGVIGLGAMGSKVALRLSNSGFPLVVWNRESSAYADFENHREIQISSSIQDFANRLSVSPEPSIVWVQVKQDEATMEVVAQLSTTLKKGDIVIDASNSKYTNSIQNYNVLKAKGISYLDVGCAGGPDDIPKGVSLMVGGDKAAFNKVEPVLKVIAGDRTYRYIGPAGTGHAAKLVHNEIFYAEYAIRAEQIDNLNDLMTRLGGNTVAALETYEKAPPVTDGIFTAMIATVKGGQPAPDPPTQKISTMVTWGFEEASQRGVKLEITRAVLGLYGSMTKWAKWLFDESKRKLTGH